ncbi:hypothetical protein CR970_01155 [Candidatus Saccharibacteria bacterium]|nr:MAG: hypothetical protein CR970_01155 [Candidatus Saccharibacteria bacterium]
MQPETPENQGAEDSSPAPAQAAPSSASQAADVSTTPVQRPGPSSYTGWQYTGDQAPEPPQDTEATGSEIVWTVSENAAHDKSPLWFAAVALIFGGVGLAAYHFNGGDWTSMAIVATVAVLFMISAVRRPREQHYRISDRGIDVGPRHYVFASFKSFAVVDEENVTSIVLVPIKRLMPPLSMHFPPERESQITEALGTHLPLQALHHDTVDRVMQRLRF